MNDWIDSKAVRDYSFEVNKSHSVVNIFKKNNHKCLWIHLVSSLLPYSIFIGEKNKRNNLHIINVAVMVPINYKGFKGFTWMKFRLSIR